MNKSIHPFPLSPGGLDQKKKLSPGKGFRAHFRPFGVDWDVLFFTNIWVWFKVNVRFGVEFRFRVRVCVGFRVWVKGNVKC